MLTPNQFDPIYYIEDPQLNIETDVSDWISAMRKVRMFFERALGGKAGEVLAYLEILEIEEARGMVKLCLMASNKTKTSLRTNVIRLRQEGFNANLIQSPNSLNSDRAVLEWIQKRALAQADTLAVQRMLIKFSRLGGIYADIATSFKEAE